MALKITSGGWTAAQIENREQRNALRDRFFGSTGAARTKSLREVHIPIEARLEKVEALFAAAAGNRIDDAGLKEASDAAATSIAMTGLCCASILPKAEQQTWGILALSPEVLKAFFASDHDTPLERSMFD